MIDHFCILTYGGVVLWAWTNAGSALSSGTVANPIDSLISNVLIEDRSGAAREHIAGDSKLRWVFSVEAQLIFVVIFPRFLQLLQLDGFVTDVRVAFEVVAAKASPRARGNSRGASSMYASVDFGPLFSPSFAALLARFDALEQYAQAPLKAARRQAEEEAEAAAAAAAAEDAEAAASASDDGSAPPPPRAGGSTLPPGASRGELLASGTNAGAAGGNAPSAPLSAAARKLLARRAGAEGGAPAAAASPGGAPTGAKARPKKENRTWLANGVAATATEAQAREQEQRELEQRSSRGSAEQLEQAATNFRAKFLKVDERSGEVKKADTGDWSEQVQERGRFATWFRTVVGNCELDMQDLDRIMPTLHEKLVSKNVAVDVAERICESLRTSLAGRKVGAFESMEKVVGDALVDALRRILRPKTEINILRSVETANQRQRPYVIVFCGVNGVGKSTSLSKIAFWLQQNGRSILVAAGDTFRHGAVEQLEVHGRCLGIPIFQMGYGTDPTLVTKQAVQYAAKNKIDVVLVDTAGRMQDHDSRMAALARLIGDNQPDLVLFVGEALVGNNGIDQLRKFNQCLLDYASAGATTRGIDGIVLTKFDTIDDKVGAAVSMVYQLGQPIVFVGVGQTYQDLKSIEPDVVVECLMR
jgi:signal recognition particle receptor subunit alpha